MRNFPPVFLCRLCKRAVMLVILSLVYFCCTRRSKITAQHSPLSQSTKKLRHRRGLLRTCEVSDQSAAGCPVQKGARWKLRQLHPIGSTLAGSCIRKHCVRLVPAGRYFLPYKRGLQPEPVRQRKKRKNSLEGGSIFVLFFWEGVDTEVVSYFIKISPELCQCPVVKLFFAAFQKHDV